MFSQRVFESLITVGVLAVLASFVIGRLFNAPTLAKRILTFVSKALLILVLLAHLPVWVRAGYEATQDGVRGLVANATTEDFVVVGVVLLGHLSLAAALLWRRIGREGRERKRRDRDAAFRRGRSVTEDHGDLR